MHILVTSAQPVKLDAINTYLNEQHYQYTLDTINCGALGLPEQPINCGIYCANERIKYSKKHRTFDMIISIESDMTKTETSYVDCAHVRIEAGTIVGIGSSYSIDCPIDLKTYEKEERQVFSKDIFGYKKTGGKILAERLGCDPHNWMLQFGSSRKDQIIDGLAKAFADLKQNVQYCLELKNSYCVYENFPKPGVTFKYFYSLFAQDHMYKLGKILASKYTGFGIDTIFALESRGLILGTLLSSILKVTFIPVQKPGKVPGNTLTKDFEKEYGYDTIEISKDLFTVLPKNCLIVDDVIATGGTIEATLEIISELFGTQVQINILALDDVEALRSKAVKKIGNDYSILFQNIDNISQMLVS